MGFLMLSCEMIDVRYLLTIRPAYTRTALMIKTRDNSLTSLIKQNITLKTFNWINHEIRV